jgi:hypothetical protein
MSELEIICDTREKPTHRFLFSDYDAIVEVAKIDVGDYKEKNLNNVCIEKKESVEELFRNLTNKQDKVRFDKELQKMKEFEYPYLVLCFELRDILSGTKFSKISPNYIISLLTEIQIKYGINIYFAGKDAEYLIYRIFKKHLDFNKGDKKWL